MAILSTSIKEDRIARTVGYSISAGNFGETTDILPQSIAVLALALASKYDEAGFSTSPFDFSTVDEVIDRTGRGSMAHYIANMLYPPSGQGLNRRVSTTMYIVPRDASGTPVFTTRTFTVTLRGSLVNPANLGSVTFRVNGRTSYDGYFFSINLALDDTNDSIATKIVNMINGNINYQFSAAASTNVITATSLSWGLENRLNLSIVNPDNVDFILTAGSYTTPERVPVATPNYLEQFGSRWHTIVINGLGPGTADANFLALEQVNGFPNASNPTGRFSGEVFSPYIALTGTELETATKIDSFIPASSADQLTNCIVPAPNIELNRFEMATAAAILFANISSTDPHRGIGNMPYANVPIPDDRDIGDFGNYDGRDEIVKLGCSTVDLLGNEFVVQNFVTTYVPNGNIYQPYRYCRDLMVDYNIGYFVKRLMLNDVLDKTLVSDNGDIRVGNTISIIQVKQLFNGLFEEVESLGFIINADFSYESLVVQRNADNPNRLDVYFRYQRSSVINQVSVTVEVDYARTF